MKRRSINRNNTSGITGVSFDYTRHRWIANIHTDVGRLVFYTTDFFEACCIRKSLEVKYRG